MTTYKSKIHSGILFLIVVIVSAVQCHSHLKTSQSKSETKFLKNISSDYSSYLANSDIVGVIFVNGGFNTFSNEYYRHVYANISDSQQNSLASTKFLYNDDTISLSSIHNGFENKNQIPRPNEFGSFNRAVLIGNKLDTIFCDSMYAPLEMRWDLPNELDSSVDVGSTITWNEDVKNANGVIIKLSFSPMQNMHSDSLRRKEGFSNSIRVEDDGEFTLSDSELFSIPDSCFVVISLSRENYKTVNSKNSKKEIKWEIITRKDSILYHF